MKFSTNPTRSLHQIKADALVVGVFSEGNQNAAAIALDHASSQTISALLKEEFKAEIAETEVLRNVPGIAAARLILVGLGKQADYNLKSFIKAQESVFNVCKRLSLKHVSSCLLTDLPPNVQRPALARIAARVLENQSYQYDLTVSQAPSPSSLESVEFTIEDQETDAIRQALREGRAVGLGMKLTRELGDLPGNICTPSYLGDLARRMAKEHDSLSAEILERKHVEALKMGAFLSVAAGTEQPPRFIILRHKGAAGSDRKPVVLVGKGVTFDSGGISLKPGAGMDEMKFDMCGAAAVFGIFRFLAESDYPHDVVGLVAATENMPSGRATKPGDVITTMSGRTVEVLNTDAEGRLVLCDALTYAERFEPEAVIDICTLTGACVIALGSINTGLYGNNETLIAELRSAGQQSQDKAWPMPLDDEYQEQLKSRFADMANIGGRPAGSVTAACFLSRFAKSYDWAHLDIAGTAWNEGSKKGANGRPVPLLAQYLLNRA